jgi:hypothetical protein
MEAHIENNVKGTTAVSILSETPVRMVKKHRETKEANPYLGAVKSQKKNGMIGFDYGNSVNNQAEREGKEQRETHSRTWGILSDSRLFVHHKGNSYLQVKVQSVTDTVYMLNGKEISAEDIKPYLSASKPSSTQADLDKQVIINDIKMVNVKAITMQGETFILSNDNDKAEQEKTSSSTAEPVTA